MTLEAVPVESSSSLPVLLGVLLPVLTALAAGLAAIVRWAVNTVTDAIKASTAAAIQNTKVTAESVTQMAVLTTKIDRLDLWITSRTKAPTIPPSRVEEKIDELAGKVKDWLMPVEHVTERTSERMQAIEQVRRVATPARGLRAPTKGDFHDKERK